MTREEILEMIEEIGLPYAYYSFEEDTAQPTPFIVFFYGNNDGFFADNSNYADVEVLNVELYTETRDFELEEKVEEILDEYGFSYSKEPAYIGDERMWQIAYEMEVLING